MSEDQADVVGLTHVYQRQAVEGRKVEITLSDADLASLVDQGVVELDLDDADFTWGPGVRDPHDVEDGEPTAVVKVTISRRE